MGHVVFRYRHIAPAHFDSLKRSESHVILESIGPIGNEFRRGVTCGGIFQLVLNRLEEVLGNLAFAVVVDREGEYLLNLLIHPLLTGTDIPDTLQ